MNLSLQTRQNTLHWWRNLSSAARIDYVKTWQASLPESSSTKKYWHIWLIYGSDSTIEQIYSFINS